MAEQIVFHIRHDAKRSPTFDQLVADYIHLATMRYGPQPLSPKIDNLVDRMYPGAKVISWAIDKPGIREPSHFRLDQLDYQGVSSEGYCFMLMGSIGNMGEHGLLPIAIYVVSKTPLRPGYRDRLWPLQNDLYSQFYNANLGVPYIMANQGAGPGCICGDPFCSGCKSASGTGATPPTGYAMGGIIPNTPPSGIGGTVISKSAAIGSFPMLTQMNAMPPAGHYTPTRKIDAYDVLKEIESHLGEVKVGSLGSCNFLVMRFTVPDRELDWKAQLAGKMDELKAKLGDKIGNLGDQQIVGLDEPYDPDGGPAYVETGHATGKIAVHLARRNTYQAYKITILALVKS